MNFHSKQILDVFHFKSFFSFRWSEHYFNSVGKYTHSFIFILADDLTFISIFYKSYMIVIL